MSQGFFDHDIVPLTWYDPLTRPLAFFDPNLVTAPSSGAAALKRWNGSAWVTACLHVKEASVWSNKPVKMWSGSSWVTVTKSECAIPGSGLTLGTVDTKVATGTTFTTHNLTGVVAGSVLVVAMANSDDSSTGAQTGSITSSPSLTWTKQADASAASSGNAEIWTAIFTAGGSITVTPTWSGATTAQTAAVYPISGQEGTLAGASAVETAETAPSTALTTTRNGSIVIGVISDWNAVSGASRAYRNSETEDLYNFSSGAATMYHFRKSVPTAGAGTWGVSAPTSQAAGVAYLEIRTP